MALGPGSTHPLLFLQSLGLDSKLWGTPPSWSPGQGGLGLALGWDEDQVGRQGWPTHQVPTPLPLGVCGAPPHPPSTPTQGGPPPLQWALPWLHGHPTPHDCWEGGALWGMWHPMGPHPTHVGPPTPTLPHPSPAPTTHPHSPTHNSKGPSTPRAGLGPWVEGVKGHLPMVSLHGAQLSPSLGTHGCAGTGMPPPALPASPLHPLASLASMGCYMVCG